MSIFKDISKKVGEAAHVAAKKSNEIVESTKINLGIKSEEDKIDEILLQIGKKLYEKFSQSEEIPEEFKSMFEDLQSHKAVLNELREKLLDIKNLKECPSCGEKVDEDITFCPKCGSKIE